MNQLSKTANILYTVVRVLKVIVIIGIVASLVGSVLLGGGLLMKVDPSVLGEPDYSVSLGDYTFRLAEGSPITMESMWKMGLSSLLLIIPSLIVTYLFLKTVGDILAPMKEGKPFFDTVSVSLKKLGIIGIVMCLLDAVTRFAAYFLVAALVPIQELFGSYVTDVEIVVGFNLEYLLMVGVCFLLSYIFRYGTELQKQSDETL